MSVGPAVRGKGSIWELCEVEKVLGVSAGLEITRGAFLMDTTSRPPVHAEEMVSCIRSGMSAAQLMNRYRISVGNLLNIFKKLLDCRLVEESEVKELWPTPSVFEEGANRRELLRTSVFVRIPIVDLEDLLNEGDLLDVTEQGWKVTGIEATAGQSKKLLIEPDYFPEIEPFTVVARCVWAYQGYQGKWFSGFQVTSVSQTSAEQLRKLVDRLNLKP